MNSLLAVTLCFACFPLFSQDQKIPPTLLRATEKLKQSVQIAKAISAHQAFQLPDMVLGRSVRVTATKFLADDGYVLRLRDVEVTTDGLVVQADELAFRWDTGEIEPSGNVPLRPVQQ